jgi:hypothetical protein
MCTHLADQRLCTHSLARNIELFEEVGVIDCCHYGAPK